MKQLDMRGKACPMPVIETKKLLEELNRAEAVTVLVDNEIAVQNLTKLAGHEGMDVSRLKCGFRTSSVFNKCGKI